MGHPPGERFCPEGELLVGPVGVVSSCPVGMPLAFTTPPLRRGGFFLAILSGLVEGDDAPDYGHEGFPIQQCVGVGGAYVQGVHGEDREVGPFADFDGSRQLFSG